MFERQSALRRALVPGRVERQDGFPPLRIGEMGGWNLVQIAAFSTSLPELENAVGCLLHGNLPVKVGEVVDANGRQLLKTGSEQFWILTHGGDDPSHLLRTVVAPDIGSITPLSHSRTRIFIEGDPAREVLAKGIALDFSPDVFGVGQFALTGLHHTPVVIHRVGQNRYELLAMRTFAQSAWEWLIDAAMTFEYEIVSPK